MPSSGTLNNEEKDKIKKAIQSGKGTRGVIWEHEFYEGFQLYQDRTFFFSFPGDECMIGLAFSDESEAAELSKKVGNRKKYAAKKSKGKSSLAGFSAPSLSPSSKEGSGKKKKGIDKFKISAPSAFRRVAHMGFDSEKGFTSENVDPTWSRLLGQLQGMGISKKQIDQNQDFIQKFVQEAGVEQPGAVPPPPPPPIGGAVPKPPPVVTSKRKAAPPPVPAPRGANSADDEMEAPSAPPSRLPPPPPSGAPPPPPPPAGSIPPPRPSAPAPPPPPQTGRPGAPPPAPPPPPPVGGRSGGTPVAPPPPPMPSGRAPGPPPAAPPPPPPPGGSRGSAPPPPPMPPSSRGGAPPPPPPVGRAPAPPAPAVEAAAPPSPAAGGGRADLLAAIRNTGGVSQLKKVNDSSAPTTPRASAAPVPVDDGSPAEGGNLAAALAAALTVRRAGTGDSDSEDESDDEWED